MISWWFWAIPVCLFTDTEFSSGHVKYDQISTWLFLSLQLFHRVSVQQPQFSVAKEQRWGNLATFDSKDTALLQSRCCIKIAPGWLFLLFKFCLPCWVAAKSFSRSIVLLNPIQSSPKPSVAHPFLFKGLYITQRVRDELHVWSSVN